MEIQVLVEDVNDNFPVCEMEQSVFEVQENEPVGKICVGVKRLVFCAAFSVSGLSLVAVVPGSPIGQLMAHDADEAGTVNAMLTYTILSQHPPTTPINAFSIDDASGQIQALRSLQRKDASEYHLAVRVSDPGNAHKLKHTTTYC